MTNNFEVTILLTNQRAILGRRDRSVGPALLRCVPHQNPTRVRSSELSSAAIRLMGRRVGAVEKKQIKIIFHAQEQGE